MQNKLKNIIVAIVNLISIITRSVMKTLESSITESVNIFRIEIKKIKKETFEKDKKDLIDNVVI